MESENLIGVYLRLLGVLECPVCLDYLTKPVALCNEGHALCSKCKSNITNCPMCRNPISSTRGVILDQIIETLLYPCYKMGCGSLLRRRDAENHDLNCVLENASDKQVVLHNNLLKNIEENFASFIVQPEIIKETRTVGTVTGKVKTADARVQTAIPFSSSLLMEKLNSPSTSAGASSAINGLHKAGPTTGMSICSMEQPPSTSFKTADLSNLAFSFPQTSSLGHNVFAFSMTPDGLNNTNMSSMYSFPQGSNFQSSLEPFQNSRFSNNSAGFNPSSKPFMFTSSMVSNSVNLSKNSSKKPSTNLAFTMESGPSHRECESGASNDFFASNEGGPFANFSIPSCSSSHLASGSSFSGRLDPELSRDDLNLKNKTSKNKPSTNLTSCSTSVSNATASNNSQLASGSLMGATQRKRPSTNLCGLTTLA